MAKLRRTWLKNMFEFKGQLKFASVIGILHDMRHESLFLFMNLQQ